MPATVSSVRSKSQAPYPAPSRPLKRNDLSFVPDQDETQPREMSNDAPPAFEPDGLPVVERAARDARDPDRRDPYEGAVPAGYDWPTHGGYLGCLIGLMASCLIGAFLGSTLFAALSCSSPIPGDTLIQGCRPLLPGVVSALLTVVAFVVATIVLARLGWTLGKRFLREYPQPRPTWGESDEGDETEADAVYATGRPDELAAEDVEMAASSQPFERDVTEGASGGPGEGADDARHGHDPL